MVLTVRLQDTEDLVTGGDGDLWDTVGVSKDDTDLGWGVTLSGKLDDLLDNRVGSHLLPGRRVTGVWDSRRGDTLSFGVKSSHFCR